MDKNYIDNLSGIGFPKSKVTALSLQARDYATTFYFFDKIKWWIVHIGGNQTCVGKDK